MAKSEFELFRMTMPEQYIRDVVLPATNVFLTETLMISEFYKWLGCHFFMACFQAELIRCQTTWAVGSIIGGTRCGEVGV